MRLLVSVRSAEEALAAMAGGADLIDVKEPLRGSMGRADEAVMKEVATAIAGRVPLSVAMGELKDEIEFKIPPIKAVYIKYGLSGCRKLDWREQLSQRRRVSTSTLVPVAYADSLMADAPDLQEVVAFVRDEKFIALLIDTFGKQGRCLFDWYHEQTLKKLVKELRATGCEVALAGSISEQHLASIRSINPGWLAVRGAACAGGNRLGVVDAELVKRLKTLMK